jgi:simple sugar transport system permease protein
MAVVAESSSTRSWGRIAWEALIRRREASIAVVTLGLVVYFGVVNDAFLSYDNMRVVANFTIPAAMLAMGTTMLLICGEIDVSLGQVYAFGPLMMYFATQAGLPLLLGIALSVLAGGVVGLVNGTITVRAGVPSFITTLGMLFLLNGVSLTLSGGHPNSASREGIVVSLFGKDAMAAIGWVLLIAVVLQIVLKDTRWGVYTFATGGNPVGAREAGVSTRIIKVGNFALAGMLAGFAGILNVFRVASIDPLAGGPDLMFLGVAAAVIGGTALAGGSGTVVGAFLGALFLGVLKDGFTIQGISAFTFDMILGIAIIVSMILNARIARLRTGIRR